MGVLGNLQTPLCWVYHHHLGTPGGWLWQSIATKLLWHTLVSAQTQQDPWLPLISLYNIPLVLGSLLEDPISSPVSPVPRSPSSYSPMAHVSPGPILPDPYHLLPIILPPAPALSSHRATIYFYIYEGRPNTRCYTAHVKLYISSWFLICSRTILFSSVVLVNSPQLLPSRQNMVSAL